MKRLFLNNLYFFLPYLCFLLGGILLLLQDKGVLFWWLNELHSPILDTFFKYITYLGEGWLNMGVVLVLVGFHYRWAIIGAIGFLVSASITQLLKRFVFVEMDRPALFFKEQMESIQLVEGVTLHEHFSFPSGHSTAIFAVMSFASIYVRNRSLGIIFFIIALLTGISRIYLAQHFFVDVYVGSIIGVFTVMLTVITVNTSKKYPKLEGGLFRKYAKQA